MKNLMIALSLLTIVGCGNENKKSTKTYNDDLLEERHESPILTFDSNLSCVPSYYANYEYSTAAYMKAWASQKTLSSDPTKKDTLNQYLQSQGFSCSKSNILVDRIGQSVKIIDRWPCTFGDNSGADLSDEENAKCNTQREELRLSIKESFEKGLSTLHVNVPAA